MAPSNAPSTLVAALLVLCSIGAVTSQCCSGAASTRTSVTLASIGGKAAYHLAADYNGYFADFNISVTFVTVANSVQGFTGLQSGAWPLFQAVVDNLVARWTNQEQRWAQAVAGVDMGKGVGLYGNTGLGMTTISALADKNKLCVDDSRSGLSPALLNILKLAGVPYPVLGDSTGSGWQVVGGTPLRYNATRDGHTKGNTVLTDPVYGTMLLTPFDVLASNTTATFTLLKTLSDVTPVYQSAAIMANKAWAQANSCTLSRLLAAFIRGDRFAKDPANAGIMKALLVPGFPAGFLSDAASIGMSTDYAATKVLADVTSPTTGENMDLELSIEGLTAVCRIRKDVDGYFNATVDGFFNAATSNPIAVDIKDLVKPGKDNLYNDKYWKTAKRLAAGHGDCDEDDGNDRR